MTVKAVAISHSAILLDDPRAVEEVRGLLQWLTSAGVSLAVLSTYDRDIIGSMAIRELPAPDATIFRTHPLVGKSKGAPEWLTACATELDCELNQIVAVGVSKYDWISAVNAGVVYIHAGWVAPQPPDVTSLVATTPRDVAIFLSHFLLERPRWSYTLDDPVQHYRLRALLPASAQLPATSPATFRLQDVFTYERHVLLQQDLAQDVLMLHALSSAYVEGLIPNGAFFVIYPSSTPGSISPQLASYLHQASTFFKAYVRTDLLVRAVQAPDTSLMRARARSAGRSDPSSMLNQSNTVHVNPAYKNRLGGRTVVVFDDFTTSGMSLEWARILLTAAGAASILGLSIGKYGTRYRFYHLNDSASFDPFALNVLNDDDFSTEVVWPNEEPGNVARLADLLLRWTQAT